jgi:hypothetical protein
MSEKTDLRKWKLHVERGRQVWKYNPDQRPDEQSAYDKYFLGLDIVCKFNNNPYYHFCAPAAKRQGRTLVNVNLIIDSLFSIAMLLLIADKSHKCIDT